ncbi:MAG: mobilization protein [Giesbergeria sp.]
MATTIDDRIQAQRDKLQQLEARKEQLEARKLHSMIKGKRSDDTRRKILAGALVLEMMGRDEATKTKFLERLDKYLKRADERKLFDLPPVASTSQPSQS